MFQNIPCRNSLYNCSNSCIEFFEIKGFYNVVISPTGKSFQLIIKFSFCSCHKNGGSRLFFSDMFTKFYTIHSWKHDIQNNNIKLMMLHYFKCIQAVFSSHNLIVFKLKIFFYIISDGLIVFDEKNIHGIWLYNKEVGEVKNWEVETLTLNPQILKTPPY